MVFVGAVEPDNEVITVAAGDDILGPNAPADDLLRHQHGARGDTLPVTAIGRLERREADGVQLADIMRRWPGGIVWWRWGLRCSGIV